MKCYSVTFSPDLDPSTHEMLLRHFFPDLDPSTHEMLLRHFFPGFRPLYLCSKKCEGGDLPQSRELSPRFARRQQ